MNDTLIVLASFFGGWEVLVMLWAGSEQSVALVSGHSIFLWSRPPALESLLFPKQCIRFCSLFHRNIHKVYKNIDDVLHKCVHSSELIEQ